MQSLQRETCFKNWLTLFAFKLQMVTTSKGVSECQDASLAFLFIGKCTAVIGLNADR